MKSFLGWIVNKKCRKILENMKEIRKTKCFLNYLFGIYFAHVKPIMIE